MMYKPQMDWEALDRKVDWMDNTRGSFGPGNPHCKPAGINHFQTKEVTCRCNLPFHPLKTPDPPHHMLTVPLLKRDGSPSIALIKDLLLEMPVGFVSSLCYLQSLCNEYKENKRLLLTCSGWVWLSTIFMALSGCNVSPYVVYWSHWSHQKTVLGKNSTCP